MTRAEIITLASDLIGEAPGGDAALNPFAWDRWLDQAARELARATDCLYCAQGADLVAGQSRYAAPGLHRVKAAWVHLAESAPGAADGARRVLCLTTPAALDRSWPRWRDAAPCPCPMYLATGGASALALFPPPDYSLEGGLFAEGYGDGGDWSAPGDCCPLPERAHMAVVYRAATLRAVQTGLPNVTAMLDGLYQTEKGRLEAEVRRYTDATRTARPPGGHSCGGSR